MLMKKKFRKIHFVGIGGIGMSGIAEVLINQGFGVSGSDRNPSDITDHLEKIGATFFASHAAENVADADVLVYSSAVTLDNVEVAAAVNRNIPVIRRAEMLAELMRMKNGIAIAGTHGKTTTSSMTGLVLDEGGIDPTLIIGGKVRSLSTNARLGESDFLVAEADEFDRSFLTLSPTIAVITNLEADHLDCYKDLDDIKDTFITFANKVPFYGSVISCLDDENIQDILPAINKPIVTYGFSSQADVQARNLRFDAANSVFDVFHEGELLATVALPVPGAHNVLNALASFCVGMELAVPVPKIVSGLAKFTGVMRRFEIKYSNEEVIIVDDYAHHPTEVKSTLKAAKTGWERRTIAIFQPHLYSRTRDFYKDFGKSFLDSDIVFITDVYPAREAPIEGISGKIIADAAKSFGHKDVRYVADMRQLPEELLKIKMPGDIFVGMGAGNIWQAINRFIELVKDAK
jgi:UDP-N-acetylmuramate--alanine ligase